MPDVPSRPEDTSTPGDPGNIDDQFQALLDQSMTVQLPGNFQMAGITPDQRQQVWDYWATLTYSQKQGILQQLKQGDARTQVSGFYQNLQQMESQQVPQGLGADPSPSPSASPAPGASASPTSTSSTTTTTPPSTTGIASALTQTSALTQQQYIDLMRLWGLSTPAEVDAMVKSFSESYAVTYQMNQNSDFIASAGVTTGTLATAGTGGTPGVSGAAPTTTAPTSPFNAYQQALSASGIQAPAPWTVTLSPRTMEHGDEPGPLGQHSQNLSAQDVYFAAMNSSGTSGGIAQRILQQYKERYANDYAGQMPDSLAQSIENTIAGLSPSQQQQWLEDAISKPGASVSIPALDDIYNAYTAAHPSAASVQSTISATLRSDFIKALGRAPTEADLKALGSNPSDIQIQQYIDQQPVTVGGVTVKYADYYNAKSALESQWTSAFGHAPTDKQILWSIGKSSAQVQDFIDNSSSAIPGITVGRYNDYTSFINGMGTQSGSTHAFSAGIDDSLIADLHHQLQSQSTQPAHPGPMS